MEISVSVVYCLHLLTLTQTKREKLKKKKPNIRIRWLGTLKFIACPYNNVMYNSYKKKILLCSIFVPGPVVQSTINFVQDWRAMLLQFCNFSVRLSVYIWNNTGK